MPPPQPWPLAAVPCSPLRNLPPDRPALCPLPHRCWPLQVAERMQLLLALQRLRDDCGFQDIVPAMWLDPVNAVMPGTGYHIQWYALWMEHAPGISMEGIIRNAATPQVPRDVMADFLNSRLNKSQVPLAAVFDLLTMQCDRHQQNILVDESGNLHLIDNEVRLVCVWEFLHCRRLFCCEGGSERHGRALQARSAARHGLTRRRPLLPPNSASWQVIFKSVWPKCAFDSMLLPTSSKYQASHLGYGYVLKQHGRGGKSPTNSSVAVHPALLLDYRCWVPKGKIGRQLPPKLGTCLADIRKMAVHDVMERYGLPDEEAAGHLKTRATGAATPQGLGCRVCVKRLRIQRPAPAQHCLRCSTASSCLCPPRNHPPTRPPAPSPVSCRHPGQGL